MTFSEKTVLVNRFAIRVYINFHNSADFVVDIAAKRRYNILRIANTMRRSLVVLWQLHTNPGIVWAKSHIPREIPA